MKLGLMLGYSGGQMRLPVEKVQLAEQLGYDTVWTAEAYGSDALSPLAYLAAKPNGYDLVLRSSNWPVVHPPMLR